MTSQAHTPTSIVVFDYGFGNVRSMVRALLNVGADVTLTSDPVQARDADGLVVPGVGAFAACMEGLLAVNGDSIIYERISANKPVLGVCVGEQVMFNQGSERGVEHDGLGLIGGSIEKIDAPVVPHMGWNTITTNGKSQLLRGVGNERFYFVHSYAARDTAALGEHEEIFSQHYEPIISTVSYGGDTFIAAVEKGPLTVTQFHPEKSGEAGAILLKNWLTQCNTAFGSATEN